MERGPQENLVDLNDYNPPVPTYDATPDYGGSPVMEPIQGLDASAVVPSWDQLQQQSAVVAEEENMASDSVTLEFTDSQVSPYANLSGKIGSTSGGTVPAVDAGDGGRLMQQNQPSSTDPEFSSAPPGGEALHASGAQPADPTRTWFWNPRRYQRYFDVDTNEVLKRMRNSLKGPLMPRFLDDIRSNPDLYGPFWVATTVIFITAVTGNLAYYLALGSSASEDKSMDWVYDIDKVSLSALLFYGYVGLIGGGLWAILAYYKSMLSLAHVWCTYGYALTIFLPVAPLCTINVEWLRWLLVLGATLMSGLFLLINFQADVREAAGAKGFMMLAVMGGIHLALGLSLKLFFFQF
eukprot:CAMPEP_0177755116 /NCGR_PEP_ID=MMETSP0491_2-20121128/2392_1 /TAXON_ID=63592 /ORGANISM="Tetraselmis chuii, Strain PLY429" /LENGTH=350 /DNA_ID=CAMNT_0019270587 /DNA_START=362 /DNA_END=1414 /DNA_ORIENTATION=+